MNKSTKGNYFIRHWRGELSLPVSFWVNLVLLSILSIPVTQIVVPYIQTLFSSVASIIIFRVLCTIILIILAFWQPVGVWRSASRHPRQGCSKFWAVLAKIVAVLWLIIVVATIVTVIVAIAGLLMFIGQSG